VGARKEIGSRPKLSTIFLSFVDEKDAARTTINDLQHEYCAPKSFLIKFEKRLLLKLLKEVA